MPGLDGEPSIYPENLLSTPRYDGRRWWAIYTKQRNEKPLARDLLECQVPFYLPLIPKRSLFRGRRVRSSIPLFRSYLFLLATDDERLKAISTNRVSQLLIVNDPEELVRDLRMIQRLIESGAMLSVESLRPGCLQAVRINAGPLAGLEGMLDGRRLVFSVGVLRLGVSAEIGDVLFEALPT
jgi:transcription termination factor NusG